MVMNSTGASAGLTLRYDGKSVISIGNWRWARSKAACTSTAASLTLMLVSNSSVSDELPSVLDDVIRVRPAIVENCFSSGSATDDAMVSGDAPGKSAETLITGVL